MGTVFNRACENNNRKSLRKTITRAEAILWTFLRQRQCEGLKFRRQCSIGRYVVDFYCPSLRLAIEIDGLYHDEPETLAYDKGRQEELETLSVHFLRFKNEDVYTNIGGILTAIRSVAENKQKKSPCDKGETRRKEGGGQIVWGQIKGGTILSSVLKYPQFNKNP